MDYDKGFRVVGFLLSFLTFLFFFYLLAAYNYQVLPFTFGGLCGFSFLLTIPLFFLSVYLLARKGKSPMPYIFLASLFFLIFLLFLFQVIFTAKSGEMKDRYLVFSILSLVLDILGLVDYSLLFYRNRKADSLLEAKEG
jgi:hypothetical protein